MRWQLRTLTTEDVSNLDPTLRGAAILWVSKKYANRTDGEHCKVAHSPLCNVTWYEVRERKQHRALGPGKGSLEEVKHALNWKDKVRLLFPHPGYRCSMLLLGEWKT